MTNGLPLTIDKKRYSLLFSYIELYYIVEDRRPDLISKEAAITIGYKYKTIVRVKLFWWTWHLIAHTLDPPYIKQVWSGK